MLRNLISLMVRFFAPTQASRQRNSKVVYEMAMVQALEWRQMLSGQSIVVTSLADDTAPATPDHMTLRDAIKQANTDPAGDTITFAPAVSGGTITLGQQGVLSITNSMSIQGFGQAIGSSGPGITISGNNVSEIFTISSPTANVNISELSLTGGKAQLGAAIFNAGTLTIGNDNFSNNLAFNGFGDAAGGAIYNQGTVISSHNQFDQNQVIGNPTSNTALARSNGGAIYNSGAFTSTQDSITNNSAPAYASDNWGGAIYNFGTLNLTNDTVSGNSAIDSDDHGGGLYNAPNGIVNSFGTTYDSNHATGIGSYNDLGGGIYNAGTMASQGDTISGNSVSGGTQNAGNIGGGVYNGGVLSLTNDTVAYNSATGLSDQNGGNGAGIWNHGTLTTTDVTVTGNTGTSGAGVTLETLTPSQATPAVWNSLNTIVAGNFGGDVAINTPNGIMNAKNTLIGDTSSGLTTGVNGNQVGVPVDQTFVTDATGYPLLANYGGSTESVALAAGSPAIGAGAALSIVTADNNSNQLTVDNVTFIATGDSLRIGSEVVLVTGVTAGAGTTGTLTVTRAVDGTAQTNLSGMAITLANDQRGFLRHTNDIGSYGVAPVTPQTLVVTSLGDIPLPGFTTMRQAIDEANRDVPGDTITFASSLSGGTIVLANGELDITKSMTITGLGSNQLTVSGNNNSNIFDVQAANSNVIISGLTLTGGTANQGGAILNTGTLTLSYDVIAGNTAVGSNGQGAAGGAIYNTGTLYSSNDSFANNSVTSDGSHGLTQNLGGAIDNLGTMTSVGDVISGNFADGSNSDNWGIGIFNTGTIAITNDTISGNQALNGDNHGVGIYNKNGTVTSTNTTYSNNEANTLSFNDLGGGIYNAGMMTSEGDTISGNSVSGNANANIGGNIGGGIYNGGTLSLTNDTVANNSATGPSSQNNGNGGGIWNHGTLTTTNVTITGNIGTLGGGVTLEPQNAQSPAPVWNSLNTIIAGNIGGDVANGTGLGIFSAKNTLIGDTSSGLTTGVNGNAVGVPVNRIFVTDSNGNPVLASNGGPTKTVQLIPSSSATDAGSSLTVLSNSATAADQTLTVADSTFLAVGTYLQIDTEIVDVTSITGNVVTVARGLLNTTIASHATNASVNLLLDQNGVRRTANDLGSVVAPPVTTPVAVVTVVGGIYTGNSMPISTKITGILGDAVDGSVTYAYFAGNGTALSQVPTDVGSYTVIATFTSGQTNYANATSAPATFNITPATPTISVTSAGGVYTGHSIPATAAVTDVNGNNVSGRFTYKYYANGSSTGTSQAPTAVGTYSVVASFTPTSKDFIGVQSNPMSFSIVPGAPSQLSLVTKLPSTLVAGSTIGSIVVQVRDALGQLVTTDSSTSLSLVVDGKTYTTTDSNGIATFTNVTPTKASGSQFVITSSTIPNVTPVTRPISVTPGKPDHLAFTTQPLTSVVAGSSLGTVTVSVVDAYNNVIKKTSNPLSLSLFTISGGPIGGGSALVSTPTFSLVNGSINIQNLVIKATGSYQLVLTDSADFPGATFLSNKVAVTNKPATHLAVVQGLPKTSGTAGVVFSSGVQVALYDDYGNLAVNDTSSVVLSITNSGHFASGQARLTVKPVGGIATFSLLFNKAQSYSLTVADSSLPIGNGVANLGSLLVNPAIASKLVVTSTIPQSVTSGSSTGAITVQLQDAFGNVLTGDNKDSISLTINGIIIASKPASGGSVTFDSQTFSTKGVSTLKFISGKFSVSILVTVK